MSGVFCRPGKLRPDVSREEDEAVKAFLIAVLQGHSGLDLAARRLRMQWGAVEARREVTP